MSLAVTSSPLGIASPARGLECRGCGAHLIGVCYVSRQRQGTATCFVDFVNSCFEQVPAPGEQSN